MFSCILNNSVNCWISLGVDVVALFNWIYAFSRFFRFVFVFFNFPFFHLFSTFWQNKQRRNQTIRMHRTHTYSWLWNVTINCTSATYIHFAHKYQTTRYVHHPIQSMLQNAFVTQLYRFYLVDFLCVRLIGEHFYLIYLKTTKRNKNEKKNCKNTRYFYMSELKCIRTALLEHNLNKFYLIKWKNWKKAPCIRYVCTSHH